MVKQLQERYDKVPDEYLINGGFAKKENIEQLDPDPDDDTSSGMTVYAPVQNPKEETRDPHQPRAGDSPKIAACESGWGPTKSSRSIRSVRRRRSASTRSCATEAVCISSASAGGRNHRLRSRYPRSPCPRNHGRPHARRAASFFVLVGWVFFKGHPQIAQIRGLGVSHKKRRAPHCFGLRLVF